MPTYDEQGRPTDERSLAFPDGFDVRRVTVRHGSVIFFDSRGREGFIVSKGSYPGAGMGVEIASFIEASDA